MDTNQLQEQLLQQRRYFNSGATRSFAFRQQQLKKLRAAILQYEQPLHEALYADLKKSPEESWVTETGFTLSEISATLKHLKQWMQPRAARTNLLNLPSKSYTVTEPLGVVLIIAPWNYPLQLLFTPMVGAIAAGNCITLKSSEHAPATSAVIKTLIQSCFDPEYILFTEGDGATIVPAMMQQFRFDHVFFTGSTTVGRLIYKMAADQLTPATLELGGKSPCVVEADANIAVAARRIAVAAFSNAGQMCVSPDYILVHASRKDELVEALKKNLVQFFSEHPEQDYNYCKIINERQFDRLSAFLSQGTILFGGAHDRSICYIQPTLLGDVSLDSPVMQEEIFGPIRPVFSFQTKEEALAIIAKHPNPLAFYVYTSSNSKEKEWINAVPFGGGCINNSSWHLTNHNLPFGGRGASGIGAYHGQTSYEVFSHRKAIMKTPVWFDPSIKYPPFKGKLKLFKWVIR
jgi:aldehyde dehydrogenase (NAD+)